MSNRAAKYEQLHKSLKKHFRILTEPGERSVLEHLLYACCLEDAKTEQADEAFAKLQQAYFDWNEVRVTTVIELGEALVSLPNAIQAGHRIKRCLQSLFEARYQYDIDDLKKANLSKATEEMSAWKGISPFILNYVSQNALGGHAIPADTSTLEVMVDCEILTPTEAEKKILPGVERAIPKNKGNEFASLLHQFAMEFRQHPKSAVVLAVFKELGVTQKAKAILKPTPKKAGKTEVAGESAPSGLAPSPKSKSSPPVEESAKNVKKTESITSKKSDKPSAESLKTKDKHAKAESKSDSKSDSKSNSKSEKASDSKKKTDAKVEAKAKAEAKSPSAKKTEIQKTETKSAPKKEEKTVAKKPIAKPPTKDVSKKPTTPANASKQARDTKKSVPSKKAETPSPATSKKAPNANLTKKKPR